MTRMEELAWFVGSMMAVNSLVFVLCGALELVERYGLFRDAKIHKKPPKCAQPGLKRVIFHLLKVHLVVQPLGLPVFYTLMKWSGVRFGAPGPGWQEVILHLPLFLLIEDTCFYWAHRALHTPFLYKHVHKMHHEYKQPHSWAVEYSHPVEYVLANSIGIFLGAILLSSHIHTFYIWIAIRTAEGVDGHSGYDFWFSPFRYFPFRPGANVHDYHHSHNVGNYGSFFVFWDTICGTNMSNKDYVAMETKAKKTFQNS